MPMTGAHISCSTISTSATALKSVCLWSETFASVAAQQVTGVHPVAANLGRVCFEIAAGVDLYYAIGSDPNATVASSTTNNNARTFLAAGAKENVFGMPGDKVAIVAA